MTGTPNRTVTGPPIERSGAPDRWIPWLLLVGFTLLRLPFRSQFLVNWDAVNFALGIESFDLGHHQPHAPGYIGYVTLGRLLASITGDANGALTLLSALAGGALAAGAYLLARRFLDRRYALLAAVLLGTSPVVWYYSSVALTYVVSAALTVPFVWAAIAARQDGSRRHLLLAAVLLGSVGAIRQTDLAFLLPLFLYAAWAHPPRTRWQAAGVLGAVSALWLVPLLMLSGGLAGYLARSAELAQLAGGRTWALGANPIGWAQNIGLVALGIVLGLNVGLLAVPLAVRSKITGRGVFGDEGRRMLVLWGAPALLTYLFVHTGQIGYVLLVLPALTLWAAAVAQARGAWAAPKRRRPSPMQRWLPRGAGVVALLNTGVFVLFPPATSALFGIDGGDRVGVAMANVVEDGGVVERTRQYDLDRNDSYWQDAVDFVGSFEADEAAVLALPASGGSFRHFGYYLEDHHVYGIGFDRSDQFGHLFTAFEGSSDYAISGLRRSQRVLELPDTTRWLVVADRAIQARIVGVEPTQRLTVASGPDIVAYRVEPGSVVVFVTLDKDVTRIAVWPASEYERRDLPRFGPETPAPRTGIG